jgi:hypothetical protein
MFRIPRGFANAQSFINPIKYSNSFKQKSQNYQYKRFFHMHSKRPKVSNFSNKWNVYDELKLYSYTSHLAFFMLLPPIIQMYTTKVEVTRDDTLTESSFATVQSNHGLVIKNFNFLDILETEKNKLIDLYLQNEPSKSSTSSQQSINYITTAIENLKDEEIENPPRLSQPTLKNDDEFQVYLLQLDKAYNALKHNSISNDQYYLKIEKITDSLVGRIKLKKDNKELFNNTIMKIFDQLHNLKLHEYENSLFRRLLSVHDQREINILNIRQKIIFNYEFSKTVKSSNKKHLKVKNRTLEIVPTYKLMGSSIWLKDYVKSFERFAQLVELFAITNQSKKSFNILFNLGFNSPCVCNKMQDGQLRYGLITALRGLNKNKEAFLLETRMKKLISRA